MYGLVPSVVLGIPNSLLEESWNVSPTNKWGTTVQDLLHFPVTHLCLYISYPSFLGCYFPHVPLVNIGWLFKVGEHSPSG